MSDEELSRASIHQIACQVQDDEADPEDARRLMEQFCDLFDRREPIPPELLRYIRDSFAVYLSGQRKTLDRAFGRMRKRGRPRVDQYKQIAMAAEVLRARLNGETHQDALTIAKESCHRSESVINEAWSLYQQDALYQLRIERALDRYPWSTEEVTRLTEIFGKKGWFLNTGKIGEKTGVR